MPNRPEWQLVNHTAAAYSLVMTSLYDTLGPGVVEYCINHADVKVGGCATQSVLVVLIFEPSHHCLNR